MSFETMGLTPPLLAAVRQQGYERPTPIQEKTIPLALAGKDVLGCAQTGTGKTAAFALPILQRLDSASGGPRRPIRALVLTPTRELALQIYENFTAYGARTSLRSCVIFGGVKQLPQTQQLQRGVDILVATPGRLNDLMGQGFIRLDKLEIFVLDEADRMLDMGFIHDVRKVIRALPQRRQTLFFSATMPPEVEKLALDILNEPATVKVDPVTSTVDSVRQQLYLVDKANKKRLLADLLRQPQVESALVFVRTRHGADRVVRELKKAGIDARAIHGDKSQGARQEALSQFKEGKVRVLVATDIAARGIDIHGLSHVFNYDLPNEPEAYIHRIGRTGRAGLDGDAVSFCCVDEMKQLAAIEKLTGKTISRTPSPYPMEVLTPTQPQGQWPGPRAAQGEPRREAAQSPRREAAQSPRRETVQSPRRETAQPPRREMVQPPRRERVQPPRREMAQPPRRETVQSPRRETAQPPRQEGQGGWSGQGERGARPVPRWPRYQSR